MTSPTPGTRVTFGADTQSSGRPASRAREERTMPYAARVKWRSPTPMREQEVDRPAALNMPAIIPPKPQDLAAAPTAAQKRIKRKRYLNNKAMRRAQQVANKLPPASAPPAALAPWSAQHAAPASGQLQPRKPWKGRSKGKGKGSKKGKKGRSKGWRRGGN